MSIRLTTGRNGAFLSEMEHVRRTGLVSNEPARNHTGPRCPTAQASSVLSRIGLPKAGSENMNCHHSALHSESSCERAGSLAKSLASLVLGRIRGPARRFARSFFLRD